MSDIAILRQRSMSNWGLGDISQLLVKSTSLEEVDECELPNHEAHHG